MIKGSSLAVDGAQEVQFRAGKSLKLFTVVKLTSV